VRFRRGVLVRAGGRRARCCMCCCVLELAAAAGQAGAHVQIDLTLPPTSTAHLAQLRSRIAPASSRSHRSCSSGCLHALAAFDQLSFGATS
jgi:hypothetical protein